MTRAAVPHRGAWRALATCILLAGGLWIALIIHSHTPAGPPSCPPGTHRTVPPGMEPGTTTCTKGTP